MATCANRKQDAAPLQPGMHVTKVIERDERDPNVALVETGKDQRVWVLLNVNKPEATYV